MLLLVSCLAYSSTLKMEAICSCETSGCHRTTRPSPYSLCLHLNCRPAQKLAPACFTVQCTLARRRVADMTLLIPLSWLRACKTRRVPYTPVPPSLRLWHQQTNTSHSAPGTHVRRLGPGRYRCRYVAFTYKAYGIRVLNTITGVITSRLRGFSRAYLDDAVSIDTRGAAGGMRTGRWDRSARRKPNPCYLLVHHSFHLTWPGIKLGPPRWEPDGWPPQLRHNPIYVWPEIGSAVFWRMTPYSLVGRYP
jgi:hypothetical protein